MQINILPHQAQQPLLHNSRLTTAVVYLPFDSMIFSHFLYYHWLWFLVAQTEHEACCGRVQERVSATMVPQLGRTRRFKTIINKPILLSGFISGFLYTMLNITISPSITR
ncbi:hypothetical protein GBA52_025397 [Prunus armeniaca]|nr:hypothetical protein GBA52_025397 [Prunus armeniaca]